jgi:hypothetical protein
MVSQDLKSAYLNTLYKVFQPVLEIKIGLVNEELDVLLIKNNCTEWAYITAFNPYSQPLSAEQNKLRHAKLRDRLQHYRIFEGEGAGEDANWQAEKSFLVIGITKSDAAKIGILSEQNAIVIGEKNKPAELLMLV